MSATTVVAIYGAVLATAGFARPMYERWADRRERVEVLLARIDFGDIEFVPPLLLSIDNNGERDLKLGPMAFGWGPDRPTRTALVQPPGSLEEVANLSEPGVSPILLAREAIPEVVRANDSVSIGFTWDAIRKVGLDLDDPELTAQVHVGRRNYRTKGIHQIAPGGAQRRPA